MAVRDGASGSESGSSLQHHERVQQLLAELISTMRDQVISINRLAESNLLIVDAMMQDASDEHEARPTYLDGSAAD